MKKREYKIDEEELDKIRKFIINKCKTLKEYEHIEIFNIIKKGGIQYTENKNGIFVNLNKLPIDLLLDLNKHVSYYVNNKDLFNMETNKRDTIKKIIKETYPQENFTRNNGVIKNC